MVQEESKQFPQFATKIEIKLASIKWRFPNRFLCNAEFTVLRDRLFFGLKKQIRDSIRFRFSDPTISYSELLRLAREAEVEERGTDSGSKRKSDTTDKPKVSVAVVVESDKVNSADFDKLKSLACKMEEENRKTQILMKDIQDAPRFKEIKGVDLEVDEEAMVMVEVEGMEDDVMVIIKVIAEVEVEPEADVGEEVMVEVITIKPKIKIREIIKPKVTKIKLRIKNKHMMVILQSSPLVIIAKDREEIHSVFIVKGVMMISTIGHSM